MQQAIDRLNAGICVNGVTREEATMQIYRGIGMTDKVEELVRENVVKCLDCSEAVRCPFAAEILK